MKSIRNKNLAVLIAIAMIFSMTMTPAFAAQESSNDEVSPQIISDETVIELHEPHKGIYSADEENDIDNKPEENGGLDEYDVVWHFVLNLPNNVDESLLDDLELQVEFDNAGEVGPVEGQPSGENSNGNYHTQHFYVGTDSHDTLLDAKVVVDGVVDEFPGEGLPKLVLSHVAYGDVEEPEEPNDGILEVTKVIETDFGDMPPILMAENENTEEKMEFEIEIENADTNEVMTKVITEGTQQFNVAPGTYYLWESKTNGATPSYSGDIDEDYGIEGVQIVIEEDQTTSITITNTFSMEIPFGEVEILKTIDHEDGVPHEGVEFTLTRNDDFGVHAEDMESRVERPKLLPGWEDTQYTDSDGRIHWEGLFPGEYTVTETVPDGFTQQLFEAVISVSMGETTTVNVVNEMIRNERVSFEAMGSMISGFKFDPDDEGLEGWTIELYNGEDEEPMDTAVTDEDGYYEFTGLQPGTYIVAEVMQNGWVAVDEDMIEQEVVIGNEKHDEALVNFYGDTELIDALSNDHTAFIAEGRIGNNAMDGDHEVNIHTAPYTIQDQGNWIWNNNGIPVKFELSYNPDTNEVHFMVGNKQQVSYTLPEDEEFHDLMIRTRATKEDSGVMINNLWLNKTQIDGTSVAVGNEEGIDVLWISGQELMEGFSLTGYSTMYWSEEDVPTGSHLAYQIKAGTVPVEEDHEVIFVNGQEEVLDEDDDDDIAGDEDDEDIDDDDDDITDIDDDETPLGTDDDDDEAVEEEEKEDEEKEETIILDEETPLGTDELPQTGDRNPLIFFVSGLILTVIGVVLKRFAF